MRRFFLKLNRRRALHRDLAAELEFHREMSRDGANPIPLGNSASLTERALDLWRFNFAENLWRDIVYALRGLTRNPSLVAAALLSLGLGIGVNTAIFTLGVQFLFSTPSVRDPASVVAIRLGGNSHSPLAALDFLRSSGLFENVVGEFEEALINYNDGRETHRTYGVYTTKSFFTSLGVPMLHGRGFAESDPDQTAVLNYGFWRRYFNGDPSVLGRVVNLDGRLCTIIGILPEDHRTLLGFGFSPDLFVPRYLDTTQLAIFARVKPGMPLGAARAGLQTVSERMDKALAARFPFSTDIAMFPLAGFARFGTDKGLMQIGFFFGLLLAITGLVLVIACINVASLLLARGSARRGEIAVRLALGAGRGRLLQQLLTESALLSIAGAALGFALARIAAALLAGVELPIPIPVRLHVEPDWRVTIYAALLASFAAAASGLLPAWQSVKASLAPDLQRAGRTRLLRILVTAQIGVSVIVLCTGFLFVRNLAGANRMSPGFDVNTTLRADVSLPPGVYDNLQRRNDFIERALGAFRVMPGIEAASAASIVPFNDNSHVQFPVTFRDTGRTIDVSYAWNAVTPDFFRAMRIPFLEGRLFTRSAGDARDVIVNSAFVQRYLAGREPLGAVFAWTLDPKPAFRVIGVVAGTKTMTIGEEQKPQVYESLEESQDRKLRVEFVLRSSIPPALQLDGVRRELHRIEPMAGAEVETMYSSLGFAFLPSQVGAILLGSIGVLGLLLATVGLYGVMVYTVARRTREIGVRIAIGASRRDISRMVLGDSARLTLIGSVIGLCVALFVTRPLAIFLIDGLHPDDPLTLGSVAGVMIVTGIAAAWGPMRRALAVDPNAALRNE